MSSSEAGEMCTWDLVDGKCRESVKLTQVHTNIQVSYSVVEYGHGVGNDISLLSSMVKLQ